MINLLSIDQIPLRSERETKNVEPFSQNHAFSTANDIELEAFMVNSSEATNSSTSNDAFGKRTGLNNKRNDEYNKIAKNIRLADQSMKTIGKHIDEMRDTFIAFTKQYPPYPPDSEERIDVLKKFSSFRQQIDQLTIPADNKEAIKNMANPSPGIVKEGGDWDFELVANGENADIQQVNTGPKGLNIPELPQHASDEEINQMIENLDLAKAILGEKRAALVKEASDLIVSKHEDDIDIPKLYNEYGMELRQTLKQNSTKSLTGTNVHLKELIVADSV